jgi:hypothetical protein
MMSVSPSLMDVVFDYSAHIYIRLLLVSCPPCYPSCTASVSSFIPHWSARRRNNQKLAGWQTCTGQLPLSA